MMSTVVSCTAIILGFVPCVTIVCKYQHTKDGRLLLLLLWKEHIWHIWVACSIMVWGSRVTSGSDSEKSHHSTISVHQWHPASSCFTLEICLIQRATSSCEPTWCSRGFSCMSLWHQTNSVPHTLLSIWSDSVVIAILSNDLSTSAFSFHLCNWKASIMCLLV